MFLAHFPPKPKRPNYSFPHRYWLRLTHRWEKERWHRRIAANQLPHLTAAETGKRFGFAPDLAALRAALFAARRAAEWRDWAPRTLAQIAPDDLAAIREAAELTNKGQLRILSNEYTNFDGLFPWHHDFQASFAWPLISFDLITSHPRPKGADIKVPWELSRFQWLLPLGVAALSPRDTPFALFGLAQILDWIDRNPVGMGVNWTCSMDVGIRAANWCVFLSLVDPEQIEPEQAEKIILSLLEHGCFLANHLEVWDGLTSNHYLGNLAGLLRIGNFFAELSPICQQWLEFACEQFAIEATVQLLPDGMNFEASTMYHRLVTEFFLDYVLLARRAGLTPPTEARERIRGAVKALRGLEFPDGQVPAVGDNDSGRLYIWRPGRNDRDVKYLLEVGSRVFSTEAISPSGRPTPPEVPLWLGAGHEKRTATEDIKDSVRYQHGGLAVLRDREGLDAIMLSAGPNGQRTRIGRYLGGHSHNDKLALVVALDGVLLLDDPGQPCYTGNPAERNIFRSGRSHSSFKLEGHEPNPIDPGKLFELADLTNATITTWKPEAGLMAGRHEGYHRLNPALTAERQVELRNGVLTVEDSLTAAQGGAAIPPILLSFVCAIGVAPLCLGNGTVILAAHGRRFRLQMPGAPWLTVVEATGYAPGFGWRESTMAIRARLAKPQLDAQGRIAWSWSLRPEPGA